MKFSVAVLFLVTLFSFEAFAEPKLPDYSGWFLKEYTRPYLLFGHEVQLLEKVYEDIDIYKKLYKAVAIIHNENNDPWLILYLVVPGEFFNGHGLSENFSEKVSVFEYMNNSWKFKKDFSLNRATGHKTTDFLKKRYNLEYR